jgi:hypothetical protein
MRSEEIKEAELIVAIRDLSVAFEHTRRKTTLVADDGRTAPVLEQSRLYAGTDLQCDTERSLKQIQRSLRRLRSPVPLRIR